jgi:fluoroacetyl-CoA thioesterase
MGSYEAEIPGLVVGLEAEASWVVEDRHLASYWGSGLARVFGTPMLVALCEEASRLAVEPLLPPGKQTVGTWVSLRHLAATPPGMRVRARARLVEVRGTRLRFRVEAWDETERIGEAEHERVVVDSSAFHQKIAGKL